MNRFWSLIDGLLLIGDDPKTVRIWRANATLVMLLMLFHVAQACGFLQWAGLSPYAMAEDVAAQKSQLNEVQIQLLEDAIFRLRIQQCGAARENKGGGVYWSQLQSKLRDYQKLTGQQYPLPGCNEL